MKTRHGIYYNFAMSEYRTTENGLTFVFSSRLHLEKFRGRKEENRSVINYSLSKRFNVKINVDILADIVLYKKIETRGFLILNEDNKELEPENIIFKNGKAELKL